MTRFQKSLLCVLGVMLLAFAGDIAFSAFAQHEKRKAAAKEETYTRPAPTKPVRPVIPSQNRYQSDKVFLEYADSLYKMQAWNDTTERQIVSGNVKFRQGSLWMFCDSAYYYPEINSLDAFGHIRMEQADTLFVYADQLFYNGNERLAKLTNGPSEPKVKLKDPSGELLTDTLDYDVNLETGYYGCGGLLRDDVNTLTSTFGQYNSRTKDAEFFYNVELINHKDNFSLLSDTLYYNTATHIAVIDSPTDIYGPNDTIKTSQGWYNTQLGNLEMESRSILIHLDSLGRATVLEGDSIVYDNATRISRAFQYRDLRKLGQPTVITDTASKIILISEYGMYDDLKKEAFATGYPLLKEYSRPDTLYLRADTIFTWVRQDTILMPKFEPWRHVISPFDPEKFEYLEWPSAGEDFLAPLSATEIRPLMKSMLQKIMDEYDQSREPAQSGASDQSATSETTEASDLSEQPEPSGTGQEDDDKEEEEEVVYEPKELPEPFEPREKGKLPPPEMIISEIREYHVAKAYPRARFFNQDAQGVADTLEFYENDSLMFMKRKPVVWSGERQVTGKEIILHFNDSTVDHALLPNTGMMAEYVDEDYYNQLAGKKMEAWFEDSYLKRLYVDGNVQVIMLPMENDSTFNKLVDAESSYMTVDMKDRQMEKIKMWPEVTGNATPLFLVKKAQKYLPRFQWLDAIRPKRVMVEGTLRWEDELGEVPEELDLYFSTE